MFKFFSFLALTNNNINVNHGSGGLALFYRKKGFFSKKRGFAYAMSRFLFFRKKKLGSLPIVGSKSNFFVAIVRKNIECLVLRNKSLSSCTNDLYSSFSTIDSGNARIRVDYCISGFLLNTAFRGNIFYTIKCADFSYSFIKLYCFVNKLYSTNKSSLLNKLRFSLVYGITYFIFFKSFFYIDLCLHDFFLYTLFKRHRVILSVFRKILNPAYSKLFSRYGFDGYELLFYGKLGGFGGSKKRRYRVGFGYKSTTSFDRRVYINLYEYNTLHGRIGSKLSLCTRKTNNFMFNSLVLSQKIIWFFILFFLVVLVSVLTVSIQTQDSSYDILVVSSLLTDCTSSLLALFSILSALPCFFLIKSRVILNNGTQISPFLVIFFSILLLSCSNSIINFFFYYELLLLSSVYLVWSSSPNRRSLNTSLYFLFWTQTGSFLVFIGVSILFFYFNFTLFDHIFTHNIGYSFLYKIASYFIFIGFGIKIPLWPFHFWLTKTHVEASTGFSIFLSGVLVKTAILGLFKFSFIFCNVNSCFIFILISYGIVDVSFKLYSQTDLKKLIAYSTIQEMSMLLIVVCYNSLYTRQLLIYFCFFHTAISGIFFLINDFLYKRTGSRHITNISGLLNSSPFLAILILFSLFLFLGLPLTVKFFIEMQVLHKILLNNPFFGFLFIFIVQYMSMVFFFKNIIFLLLGPTNTFTVSGLSLNELIYYVFFLSIVFILSAY